MAEYNDVIKQFKRMCRYYHGDMGECPLYCKGHGCNISHCRMLAFEDKKFANVVMSWAAEHPEPVYPTWGEWLMSIGVISGLFPQGAIDALGNLKQPIPSDMAQKLGVFAAYEADRT